MRLSNRKAVNRRGGQASSLSRTAGILPAVAFSPAMFRLEAPTPRQPGRLSSGFTLPAVLVVVGALLILAVGLLLVVGIERDTARSFVDRQRAELAARAGLEDLRGIFATEAANDDFIVFQSTLNGTITPGADPAPHLFIGRGQNTVNTDKVFNYRYIPLFSTKTKPADAPFSAPQIDGLTGGPAERIDFTALPYHDKVRASWLPVLDEKGRMVARYAYWVEDLQARVDPAIGGNKMGAGETHARVAWPFPAPGLNDQPESADEPALNQIALFALDPAATDAVQGELGKTLIKNRPLLVSPDSQLAAAGIRPPLERLKTASGNATIGDLADPKARAVERGLVSGIQPYLEQPIVPHAQGIDPSVAGQPKLNLNKLLADPRSQAIDEMAAFIKKALPNFDSDQRKGGFPDDYLKTLAANALDYADADDEPTLGAGYRGIDAYPLVSEYLIKPRWEDIIVKDGRKFLVLSLTVYVELWNMTDVPVTGNAQVSFECGYRFQISPNPNLFDFKDLSKASPGLTQSDGYFWFPPSGNLTLQPNEYRVIKCGTVTFTYDAVSEPEWITSPLSLGEETYGKSGAGYRMRWNGKFIDQSRGGVNRNDSSIHFPTSSLPETKSRPRQRLRLTVPGHSYHRSAAVPKDNNMGDPRMSWYLDAPQDGNAYPQNYSPNRRNVRSEIYEGNKNLVYGRVLPSEWPDGGHDSPFGSANVFSLAGMTSGAFSDEHRVEPDASGFFNQLPDLTLGRQEAPTRLSNRGRFLSVTELGRVYDPIMWQVRTQTQTSNSAGRPWGDVTLASTSSTYYGGGNTLRIGRPEHPRFDQPGFRASQLLDLFHTGRARSADAALREGPLAEIAGQVNLNTASKAALRTLIAGRLNQDPEIRRFINDSHVAGTSRFPLMQKLTGTSIPDITAIADRIADAIIRSRPFASTGELASAREISGTTSTPVFGNPRIIPGYTSGNYPLLQWTDSATEEAFARAHESVTVRSRNFRVWVIGQAVAPTTAANTSPEVLGEVRKVFAVFADPGERNADGKINPLKFRLQVLHENDF